ncbi:MAG TPA: hypothetical protein VER03_04455 [Bryobacteraceae bacterium]|nr:hypothetical protein [Bryobacteraceae bacterium]
MSRSKLSAAAAALATVLLAIYYWRFTSVSLATGFSQDDLMNLYFAWREPFGDVWKANFFFPTSVLRPFGALFYRTTLHVWGYDPLPFRIICYILLWLNLPVAYLAARRLSGSREIALTAVLLHCVHGSYFPMYFGSGSCYDVFSFFFYGSALALSLRARTAGRLLSPLECAALALLFACAVNSKEAAASLPAMLLVYELLYTRPRSISWIWREGRGVLVTGIVAILFLWSRFSGPNNLLGHPDYTPVFTIARYLESTAHYLDELTAHANLWTTEFAAILLVTMALIAAAARSRTLIFAWFLVAVGSAPMAFVTPRGLSSYYIPVLGYAIFLAVGLVRVREFLVRSREPIGILASQAILFAGLLAVLWQWQDETERQFPDHWSELRHIESAASQFRAHPEWFRPNSSLLITNDPFGEWAWASTFIASVVGNDRSVSIRNLAKIEPRPTPAEIANYTTIIGYAGGRYYQMEPSAVR